MKIVSNPFTVHTCSYVKASDLFKDCPLAMNAFCDACDNCSYGDNAHTLVTPEYIKEILDSRLDGFTSNHDFLDTEERKKCETEITQVIERLGWIINAFNDVTPANKCYIDLES